MREQPWRGSAHRFDAPRAAVTRRRDKEAERDDPDEEYRTFDPFA